MAITPYAQATQNNNKRPHGFPIGACPICNGMGGGGASRDRNKPRRAGEMSYNECLAQWHKMQQAQLDKKQAKLDKLEFIQAQKELNAKMLDKLANSVSNFQKNFNVLNDKISNLPLLLKIPAKILTTLVQPIVNLIAKIPEAIKNIQTFFNNAMQFVNQVAEKLSSFLGEMKNFIQGFEVVNKTKKTLKTFLNLFTQGEDDNKEENEEIEKLKLRELKKIFKGLFKKKTLQEEQLEKDESSTI